MAEDEAKASDGAEEFVAPEAGDMQLGEVEKTTSPERGDNASDLASEEHDDKQESLKESIKSIVENISTIRHIAYSLGKGYPDSGPMAVSDCLQYDCTSIEQFLKHVDNGKFVIGPMTIDHRNEWQREIDNHFEIAVKNLEDSQRRVENALDEIIRFRKLVDEAKNQIVVERQTLDNPF